MERKGRKGEEETVVLHTYSAYGPTWFNHVSTLPNYIPTRKMFKADRVGIQCIAPYQLIKNISSVSDTSLSQTKYLKNLLQFYMVEMHSVTQEVFLPSAFSNFQSAHSGLMWVSMPATTE